MFSECPSNSETNYSSHFQFNSYQLLLLLLFLNNVKLLHMPYSVHTNVTHNNQQTMHDTMSYMLIDDNDTNGGSRMLHVKYEIIICTNRLLYRSCTKWVVLQLFLQVLSYFIAPFAFIFLGTLKTREWKPKLSNQTSTFQTVAVLAWC